MNYSETIDYLYDKLPVFHRIGKKAFKADLSNTLAICEHLDNPHQKFKTIHIAGTNGKGSTSHYLASILQSAGYKTGLYTSPHLQSFTERIRINGQAIPEERVVSFVEKNQQFIEFLAPSFFELSVGMAFEYFASEKVDIAVIEVGLGGRLDSTNVISPLLSVITNIGYDHTDILGKTLPKIAFEKAGIIKENTPVVISERHTETESVFNEIASERKAPIFFAEDYFEVKNSIQEATSLDFEIVNREEPGEVIKLSSQLRGKYQTKNILGVLKAVDVLNGIGFRIDEYSLAKGVEGVVSLTQLKGRWQQLSEQPTVICDTAHNVDGITEILESIKQAKFNKLWMILGFVSDKDISGILEMLPKDADYVFCQASVPRALDANELLKNAKEKDLKGIVEKDVNQALSLVKSQAGKDDFIYVGGSTFIVAELDQL